jgi:hypothetical protein
MTAAVRILDALTDVARDDVTGVVFEYLSTTQAENGRPLPATPDELPAVLRAECERPEVVYAAPCALLVSVHNDGVAGCVGLRPLAHPDGRAGVVEVAPPN